MLPVSNKTVIATVRTAIIYGWVWLSTWLLATEFVANIDGVGDLLFDIGAWVQGSGVLIVGTALYALLYKLAQMDNVLGTAISWIFIFPQQPDYEVPGPSVY